MLKNYFDMSKKLLTVPKFEINFENNKFYLRSLEILEFFRNKNLIDINDNEKIEEDKFFIDNILVLEYVFTHEDKESFIDLTETFKFYFKEIKFTFENNNLTLIEYDKLNITNKEYLKIHFINGNVDFLKIIISQIYFRFINGGGYYLELNDKIICKDYILDTYQSMYQIERIIFNINQVLQCHI